MTHRSMNWPTARNKESEEVRALFATKYADDEEPDGNIVLSKLVLGGTRLGGMVPAPPLDKGASVQVKGRRSARGKRRDPKSTGLVPAVTIPAFLTTAQAAQYCGFKTTGGIRKAYLDGRIFPYGRRGGTGTWIWAREECDRFLRGEPLLGPGGEGPVMAAPTKRLGGGVHPRTKPRGEVSDDDRARARRAMRNAGMVVKGGR